MLDNLEYYLSQGVLFSNDEICMKAEEMNHFKILSEKNYNSDNKKDIKSLEKNMKHMSVTEFQKIESFNDHQINFLVNNIEYQAYNCLEMILKGFFFLDI